MKKLYDFSGGVRGKYAMKLKLHGTSTSKAEITHISKHGIWVLLDDKEFMLGYRAFPWFRNATVEQIQNVVRKQDDHLYWPMLDVDLDVNRMEDPDKYPLVSR
jgi:hypothetical protein